MNVTIITCAYNPNVIIFKRLITAISNLEIPEDTDVEWILVDNNSTLAIQDQFNFSSVQFPVKHIKEKKAGLTHARIAGAKIAKGNWLVFFDDDNEPESRYLSNLKVLIQQNPAIGCIGPGHILVDFIGKVKSKWASSKKEIFQERSISDFKFGNEKSWTKHAPQGTGLCAKKEIVVDYINHFQNGLYTMSDRTKKDLSSGGDSQIVLNAVKLGFSVGIHPDLQLNHLISGDKANFKYLVKHAYGTHSSTLKLTEEVFPNSYENVELADNSDVIRLLWIAFRKVTKGNGIKDSILELYEKLGQVNSRYLMTNTRKPVMLSALEYFIR